MGVRVRVKVRVGVRVRVKVRVRVYMPLCPLNVVVTFGCSLSLLSYVDLYSFSLSASCLLHMSLVSGLLL